MNRTDFNKWNLHDAKLLGIEISWDEKIVNISCLAFINDSITTTLSKIILTNVQDILIPHRAPCGDSDYIDEIRITEKGGKYSTLLQMISGDTLAFTCEGISLNYNESKSLRSIYNNVLENPKFKSSLTLKCTNLYNTKPILDYTVEELRIMIGQKIGLDYLVPLAIEEIEANILVEGDLYPGDLLNSVLNIPEDYWKNNKELKERLHNTITEQYEQISKLINTLDPKR
ncbi:contact-dependent growth inhibition system immunity protein [Vallitalea okinawensis]|uniref:contact-dependent growth inhibition system immunity protein n=1 Tax=Vallitalea okinawensis TaxID=2078660 RepID=UPI000CFDDDC2|nr:contact-dependent growth inhibition system immunity protein [Vallitalea okinawensis]